MSVTQFAVAALTDVVAFIIIPMALVEGPWRARLIAALTFAGFVPGLIWPTGFHDAARGARALANDLVTLAACLVCLRGAQRYWMVWATSFVLLGVVTDAVFLLWPDVGRLAFIVGDDIWWLGLAAALLWGVVVEGGKSGPAAAWPTRATA